MKRTGFKRRTYDRGTGQIQPERVSRDPNDAVRAPLLRKKRKRWRPTPAGVALNKKQREESTERDDYECTCEGCPNCHGGPLQSAHKRALGMGFSRFKESERNTVENRATLCADCHVWQETQTKVHR